MTEHWNGTGYVGDDVTRFEVSSLASERVRHARRRLGVFALACMALGALAALACLSGCSVTQESKDLVSVAAATADGDLREWQPLANDHKAELVQRLKLNVDDRDAKLLLEWNDKWRRAHWNLARALHVLDLTINDRPLAPEWAATLTPQPGGVK